jgi:hypothetical protein
LLNKYVCLLTKLFTQLFTINVIKSGKNFPLLYALLPNKKGSTYDKFLSLISNAIHTPPKFVSMDFEKAVMNAFKTEFDTDEEPVGISGCFFHLTQV